MGRKGKSSAAPEATSWEKPVGGILLAGLAAVSLLALASYRPRGASGNWAGPVGHELAGLLLEGLGAGGYAVALILLGAAGALLRGWPRPSLIRAASWLAFALCAIGLLDLLVHARVQGHPAGGALGSMLASAARSALSVPGATVVLAAVAGAALVVATDLWALHAASGAAKLGVAGGTLAVRGAAAALAKARAVSFGSEEGLVAGDDGRIVEPPRPKKTPITFGPAAVDEGPQDPREPVPSDEKGRKKKDITLPPGGDAKAAAEGGSPRVESVPPPQIVEPKAPPRPRAPVQLEMKAVEPGGGGGFTMAPGHSAFVPPPITILTGEASQAIPLDRDGLTATADKLRQKLASFGIQGQVTQIRPGPVVTMFEFLPAAGIKVSRIAGLADDLAMAMEALRVRIVAPIPGKGVVGIEVPNKQRETVVLRELVEQDAFQKSHSKLAMCLGKDIEGMPYVADLSKMPHLLIAGTTGSGKSVAVNSMIVSMLLRATPEEVRFLMVDPKMLELSVYEGIPHLLLPVVTDAKKAAIALRWGVEEMERRYQLLAECGVRNIASYNKKVEKEGDAARRPQKPPREKRVVDLSDPKLDAHDLQTAAASGELERKEADNPAVALLRENERKIAEGNVNSPPPEPPPEPLKKLPYLVIIIDELADLMMVASREVETYIARLAQMARAAGIHLMVATQRPSTDVVTGVIKANFPARISFQVASRHDSGTIINSPGAENLLGMGDMLILPPGTSTLTRVHGPYVDEKEIHAVVEHWKAQGAPVYDPSILRPRAEDDGMPLEDEGPDELYDQAVAALADMRFISISLLQRKLRVGYNRAARMIERMERDGIVGPADGAKPREVLIRPLGEMPGAGA
ncbi:MAG TPA: DNA translocase FtsK 4TM domain-containing protein [Myxococcales bacterium]|nr:DNA translocase FtsK 4TM domain-containing protein [Myxococcales bacterium]